MRHVTRVSIFLMTATMLAGCSTVGGIFKKKEKITVPGERVAVLVNEAEIDIDPATATLPMSLPAAEANTEWAQSGGNARKSVGHVGQLSRSLGWYQRVSLYRGRGWIARRAGLFPRQVP